MYHNEIFLIFRRIFRQRPAVVFQRAVAVRLRRTDQPRAAVRQGPDVRAVHRPVDVRQHMERGLPVTRHNNCTVRPPKVSKVETT